MRCAVLNWHSNDEYEQSIMIGTKVVRCELVRARAEVCLLTGEFELNGRMIGKTFIG